MSAHPAVDAEARAMLAILSTRAAPARIKIAAALTAAACMAEDLYGPGRGAVNLRRFVGQLAGEMEREAVANDQLQ